MSTSRCASRGRCSARRAIAAPASGLVCASTRTATRRRAPRRSRTSSTIPELLHDEQVWIRFTEDIVRGMGGDGPAVSALAIEVVRAWEHAPNFELYEDAPPVLRELRRQGLLIGLVSNTSRDLARFVDTFSLDVDAWVTSASHGMVKPSPSIFLAALRALDVEPACGGDGRRLAARRRRGRAGARHAGVPARSGGALPGSSGHAPRPLRAAGGAGARLGLRRRSARLHSDDG